MTNDVVAGPSQEQSKDMDQGNRKRSAPKDVEEELTKKRIRDGNASAETAEAAEGKPFVSQHLIRYSLVFWIAHFQLMLKVELGDLISISHMFSSSFRS